MTVKISASLVLYNSQPEDYSEAIISFLAGTPSGILTICDNSEASIFSPLFDNPRINYIFNNSNLGFGAAHNRAIQHTSFESDFHLVLNPDIHFEKEVIPHLIDVMRQNPDIGVVMPRVNYPDGSLQRLCKLLPTPIDLIFRRFIPVAPIQDMINFRYELHALPQDRLIDVPTISGCCLLFRTELFRRLGGFDERYFMYLEDVDLVRRIGDHARTVYDPRVSITHNYAKGSYSNSRLLRHHIRSAIRYFCKWGWLVDTTRFQRNRAIQGSLTKGRQGQDAS